MVVKLLVRSSTRPAASPDKTFRTAGRLGLSGACIWAVVVCAGGAGGETGATGAATGGCAGFGLGAERMVAGVGSSPFMTEVAMWAGAAGAGAGAPGRRITMVFSKLADA